MTTIWASNVGIFMDPKNRCGYFHGRDTNIQGRDSEQIKNYYADVKNEQICKSMLEMLKSHSNGVSIMNAKYYPPQTFETEGLNYSCGPSDYSLSKACLPFCCLTYLVLQIYGLCFLLQPNYNQDLVLDLCFSLIFALMLPYSTSQLLHIDLLAVEVLLSTPVPSTYSLLPGCQFEHCHEA